MSTHGTLILTRQDVASLFSAEESVAAVEQVFRLYGAGKTTPPGILGVHAVEGGFHIKAGLLNLNRAYFAAKLNSNFPQNVTRFGLPLIQGVIALFDADDGSLLALMDSIEITILRTGAATAVAAKYLARPDSKTILICGCGNQGTVSLRMLSRLFPLQRALAYDIDAARAEQFARGLSTELQIQIDAIAKVEAAEQTDICVTSTPSKTYFLTRESIGPGTFIAAVGADSEVKQELDPALLSHGKVVVDILEQCAAIGELHHALDARLITRDNVYAELGEVVAGVKAGRTSLDEIIVFDSTGMALQDVVSAATVFERAIETGSGNYVDLGG